MDLVPDTDHVSRLCAEEFSVLRQTIAMRGTARMLIVPATCLGWAAIATVVTATPAAGLVPLAVLVTGFEAVHALHVGTERIGRYLQVYSEAGADRPHWETTAMAIGPALPGGGVDPLFSGVFIGLTLLNLAFAPSLWDGPVVAATTTALHLAFALRVVRARVAASRQRVVELEGFKALQSRERSQT